MALPQLNSTPKYTMTIPSLKKEVRYRPYLVKEEKILMMAFESGDKTQTLNAVVDTIFSCLEDDVTLRPSSLTTFDVEYMFTQIRAKSVGEVAKIRIKCTHCGEFNDAEVDLEDIEMKVEKEPIIKLTDEVSLKMKYPSYKDLLSKDLEAQDQLKLGFEMITDCIESIMTEDTQHLVRDQSKSEMENFIESLTTDQFGKITAFLNNIPRMTKVHEFKCVKCGEDNTVKLEGMSDFF